MRRFGGMLGSRAGHSSSRSMTALDEPHALQEALASAALIMNDEIERAENELSQGTSPFHKLGRATALFMRAALGFEKEVMEQAGARIAEAEEAASEHHRRALRDPSTAHRSQIYPTGAEYALCHAETQLMSAVVAVLNESLTESFKGFYKLRKAFNTLYEISEAEKKFLRKREKDAQGSRSSLATPGSGGKASAGSSGVLTPATSDSDDDLEFVDAKDQLDDPDLSALKLQDTVKANLDGTFQAKGVQVNSKAAADQADNDIDFRTITTDPIDLFIHSGTNLCFGMLQLMLSMIPPAFGRILSIFSFRGNREEGLRMLWAATRFKEHANGAMAGIITLGFHNGAIAFCDILADDALPQERLRSLLTQMREKYPKSKLWSLEEARMLSGARKLEAAVEAVLNGPKSPLKQVEALGLFELSLNLMYLHRYQNCADSFIECVGMNNWSHALYYYIAASCLLELYRIHRSTDPEKAQQYADKAEKYFLEVPTHAGKKRFMARQLPFDVFTLRKIAKWEARAKAQGCSFVDAIGVSPVVEMMYFWSGFRRMGPTQLQTCLERLAWSEDTAKNPHWEVESVDEKALLYLLRGVCERSGGQIDQAKEILSEHVLSCNLQHLKACEHPETWPLPVAHYEMAVALWQEAGGETGDRKLLTKCSKELAKVENWESYELEARVGLKITTARQTLRKIGIGPQ